MDPLRNVYEWEERLEQVAHGGVNALVSPGLPLFQMVEGSRGGGDVDEVSLPAESDVAPVRFVEAQLGSRSCRPNVFSRSGEAPPP